ncbi:MULTISPECIES: xanthine dehydrogenase family protein molybdopterin-binding subunit [unclassified Undibacterium]|uniref:xanthine dehydrogenase family protein molybdopterin-binding subunit n=1 Tax=unclassified Undibacterium TaxID=2630295 RepID=UPI002AC9EF65|nr:MULTISPECIES: molybdopterin cofactor-binding domain-containing protein [unclassified Undibacterium]MEB0138336.1 molybdopterin-dependent oxidoreductase [Undibacterium sp. CCC2.1]MEB0172713.1 molybdopterin-dependent oxidoreductase [Undibacterium sp. CCC1.1]MEB0174711.1 molybdopterin-dependent oxidoreductase [Undibacterium sp. CCC3.4]MEB0213908.1 molybdopterin-dependent oxidoreductase [Undibacterium sp. 5I2]WPX42633.1 molybdopterin-dependent oxidoreductase [Undibacterium sp. CCC3.4]
MTTKTKPGRRRFILGGLAAAGALVVAWGVLPPRARLNGSHPLPLEQGEVALNGWIKIAADGSVTVAMHKSEMGQGIHTALQMLVAEELDVPMAQVRTMAAPIDKIYGNMAMLADGLPFHPDDEGSIKHVARWLTLKTARELGLQVTGGSSSVKDAWLPLREAGATARAMLVAAAAKIWGIAPEQCHTAAGIVSDGAARSLSYGQLAAAAVASQPGRIVLKQPAQFRLIGQAQPRTDSAAKVDGSARYGIDAQPEHCLFAALKLSPTIGGTLRRVDAAAALALPGVTHVVDFSRTLDARSVAGVAVIAKTYWTAKKALASLVLEWDGGAHAQLSSAAVFAELSEALDKQSGFAYYERGDAAAVLAGTDPARVLQAQYRAPFLAHATMEPMNCTACLKDGRLDLWVSTQVPSIAVDVAAKAAGIAAEQVHLHMSFLGGGFGRRLEIDMVLQAVALARETAGLPVKLVWSREDDTTHDMYRPAALARFRAAVDAQGNILAYDNKSASGSVTQQVLARTFGLPGAGPDKTTAEGEFDMPYQIENQKIAHVIVPSAVPIGYWRSVGHSHNAFFKESFIDELAHQAGRTPLEFRRRLLSHHPRHRAVLDAAVAKAGVAAPGRAHGLALHQSFGTIVAQVAEVSIQDGAIRVHKVVCAVDCGIAVNPNIINQQMESAIIFGLSAALYGEITLRDGRVEQSNFNDYPVLRMNEVPNIEVIIIASAEAPEGIGEPGVPPIAPAVANAIFNLNGQRLRSLPLRLS